MTAVFITGAAGAVGQQVLAALPARFTSVGCLIRPGGAARLATDSRVRTVIGELLAPKGYAAALEGVGTVLHLAAATGNASPEAHQRVNRDGTAALLQAARTAGVRRVVFVSSIAARFNDLRNYPYGDSKRQAEQLVEASGLDYVIARPTQVVGRGSGSFAGLTRLVRRGWIVVPGTGRTAVQPIHIHDLALLLVALLDSDAPERLVELGGPEATTMEDLLRRLHTVRFGGRARIVHLPLGPLTALLRAVERIAGSAAPARPGQFAAFREDGAARPSALLAAWQPRMKGIEAMLSDAVERN